MSSQILTQLRALNAFKPKPPEHELARAHVQVAELGIAHPIDDRVLTAMTQPSEAFTIIIGPPGSGKSSLLAAASHAAATSLDLTPAAIPLKVPADITTDQISPDLLVRGITQSLANTLGSLLDAGNLTQLERNLATTITTARQGRAVTASLSGGLPFLNGELGVDLGHDLITMTTRSEWQGGGPIPRLQSLLEIAAAKTPG